METNLDEEGEENSHTERKKGKVQRQEDYKKVDETGQLSDTVKFVAQQHMTDMYRDKEQKKGKKGN